MRPASFNGSRTLAATVAHGIKVGSWNTKPSRASPAGQVTKPAVDGLRPEIMRRTVDFPQPEAPISVTNSPLWMVRLASLSATID